MRHLHVLAIALCAGCAVVDQTTFAPSPEAKPAAETATARPPRIDPRIPLIVIDFATPNPDYRELLRYAVRAAETRKSGVQYDVIAVVKTTGNTGSAQDHAAETMRAIMAERVPAARIHLGLRGEPAMPNVQVHVYVR